MGSPPRRVAHYTLGPRIARGGFGEVFEATDTRTDEAVALKLVATGSPEAAARFLREANILAGLAHPGIVAVRDHGRVDHGAAWIAMERLRGCDLRARIARGPLSARDAARLGLGAAEALAFAHGRGLTHRDVKPANLFLCDGDASRVKVLDFGLARRVDEDSLTRSGVLVGTLAYASPEQLRDARDVAGPTDLWSLGVTLFEALSGRLPFRATHDAGLVYQISFAQAERVIDVAPATPRALAHLIDRALSRDRAARPTAEAMAAALRGMLADPSFEASGVAEGGVAVASRQPRERRLSCVVYARAVGGGEVEREVVDELRAWGGEVRASDAGAVEAHFGVDRWLGDEPSRASLVAWNLRRPTLALSVATTTDDACATARSGAVEAGVTLDANTATLVRRLFSLRASSVGGAARVEALAPDRSAERPWVGRAAELALLVDAATQALDSGRVVGVAVLAARGMGKTRLSVEAQRALSVAAPACVACAAACARSRRDVPFAALCDALGERAAPLAALLRSRGEEGGDAVAFFDRVRAVALDTLRAVAGDHGAALIFDDAQWIDGATRTLLRWVADAAEALPLAVWTFALPEARDALAEALPEATTRTLGPLSRPQSEALLRALRGEVDPALVERAEGHPLFLEALASFEQSGASTLPLTVQATVLATLDGLDARGRDYLKRAAVVGRTFWTPLAERLGADGDALPSLVRAQLVVPRASSRLADAPEYAFRSALVHETAYELWADPARAALHAQTAAWLDARGEVDPAEVAPHWELGEAPREAALAWTRAAERSAWVDDAITRAHVERALGLALDVEVRWRALVARDTALQVSGDRALQERGLEMMELLAPSLGLAEQADACWRRCYHARMTGRAEALRVWSARGLELAREAGARRVEALLHDELALALTDAGRYDEARAHARAAEAIACALDDAWLRARTTATGAYHALEAGDVSAAQRAFVEAAEGFRALGDARREALMAANVGYALVRLGALDGARARFERALEQSRRVGNARTVAMTRFNLAVLARVRGDHGEAGALLDAAEREAARLGHGRLAAAAATERCYLRLATGASDRSDEALAREALAAATRTASPALITHARAVGLRLGVEEAPSDGAATLGDAEAGAALALARHLTRGGDRGALDAALDAFVRSLGPVDDPAQALRGFALRHGVSG